MCVVTVTFILFKTVYFTSIKNDIDLILKKFYLLVVLKLVTYLQTTHCFANNY